MVTGEAGNRQLSVNPQANAWKAFLEAVHKINGVTRAIPQGSGMLVEVTGDEKALANVANSITSTLNGVPTGRLQVAVSRIRNTISSLSREAFKQALENGISAVQAALAHSTKDGDHAQHPKILGTLRGEAQKVWNSQIIKALL
jgi:flagellar biosynthesis/type III secretory pathway ATPase